MQWSCNACGHKFHLDCDPICPNCKGEKLKKGAANGTINRELAALRRILNLGAQQTPPKVNRVPFIPMLKENNTRKGFFEHGAFLSLREVLPVYLKPFVTFGYRTGWRDTEITGLTWSDVDLKNGIVTLKVGETKNYEARTLYLDDELKSIFQEQWEQRKSHNKLMPYVFLNNKGTGPMGDFRKAWNAACRQVGLGYGYKVTSDYVKKWQEKLPPGPIFHDFRRTAVRNMIRSGTPEGVAMKISGHKTRSVFDRYNIVSDSDLKLASQRHAEYLESQTGTISGTIADFEQKKGGTKIG